MADFLEKKPESGRREMAESEMKRYDRLLAVRKQVFDSSWQTLSDYYLPNLSDINTEKTEGTSGWSDRIYDTTAIEDARTCTTGQSNWATPATEPWFQWSPPESLSLEDDDDGAIWTGICTDIALKELARSNYYRVSAGQYKSRTVFGTGHMHIEEGKESLINCVSRKIGTYCVALNSDGIVDTVYAEFKYTARQAAQEWGMQNLGPKVGKAALDPKKVDSEFTFIHVIRPRSEVEREPGKIDSENKPIASIYICKEDKYVVKVGGYDEMPDSVTRFDEWGAHTPWGYSPAFEALPNVRQLNYIVRFMDAQYELKANPRLLLPSNLMGQVDLRPGGVTPYDPNTPNALPKEWMSIADINGTENSVDKKRAAVNRLFYTDIFTMLQQIDRKMTAYEISQRIGEKLEQLSPMFSRLITEKTSVDLKRVFGILFRAGKFPKPPRSMFVPVEGGRKMRLAMPEVTYTSRLALALKSLQNRATSDTMTFISEFSRNTSRPELLDNFDIDHMMRSYAINQGMSAKYIRPMKDVITLRTARAKQAAQERAIAMTEQIAGAAGKLGKAPEALQDSVSEAVTGNAAAAA